MINFRFHLVSLIAVFLALGLGILVGSSVVDRVIVDRLDREIKSAHDDLKAANAQNDKLRQTEDFLNAVAPYTVTNRLAGVPVALVAERGVDTGTLKTILGLLRSSGADVPGVLWLTDSWRLDTTKQSTALESVLKTTGNNAGERTSALRQLAKRLATPMTTAARQRADVIEPLRSAGFLEFTDGEKNALTKFPPRTSRVVVVTGTDSKLIGSATLPTFVQALVNNELPTVVSDVYNEHRGTVPAPVRAAALQPVRGDPALAKDVSTVDDAELIQGQVTIVLALDQLADEAVGHYGYGPDANDGPLPRAP